MHSSKNVQAVNLVSWNLSEWYKDSPAWAEMETESTNRVTCYPLFKSSTKINREARRRINAEGCGEVKDEGKETMKETKVKVTRQPWKPFERKERISEKKFFQKRECWNKLNSRPTDLKRFADNPCWTPDWVWRAGEQFIWFHQFCATIMIIISMYIFMIAFLRFPTMERIPRKPCCDANRMEIIKLLCCT